MIFYKSTKARGQFKQVVYSVNPKGIVRVVMPTGRETNSMYNLEQFRELVKSGHMVEVVQVEKRTG